MHVALSALAGLLAGPLVHHLAVQTGADRPWWPPSCRNCGSSIGLVERCPTCGTGPFRVWSTIVVTGSVAGLLAWATGPGRVVVAYTLFTALTVLLFLTDIDHKRIPNRITYPGTPLLAGVLVVTALLDGSGDRLPRAFGGALVYTLFFFVVYLAARGGFGFGDVKLALPLGLMAAYGGWDRLFIAGMATALVGGVIAAAAVVARQASARTEIPYGPAMIIGTWIAIGGGQRLAGLVF